MKINKDNYEIFFLDYHEGTLPAEMAAELFLFLEKNPQLKPAFESFENISLPEQPQILFPYKNNLKKGLIDKSNYTRFFVAHVEGTLTGDEKQLLDKFLLACPEFKQELNLFEKTKLHPDAAIVYTDKRKLKKPVPLFAKREAWYYVAAAACLLFLLGVFFINLSNVNRIKMAHRENPSIKIHSHSAEQKETIQKQLINPFQKENIPVSDKRIPDENIQKTEKSILYKNTNTDDKQVAQHLNHRAFHKNKSPHLQEPADENRNENIAFLQPLEIILSAEYPEPLPVTKNTHHEAGTYYTLTASVSEIPSYLTVGELLKAYGQNKFKQVINNKPLSEDLLSQQVPGKIKGIKFLSWCYQQVTGKKVDVKTTYNPHGKLTAYHVSAGRIQFGKTFASR